MFNPILFTGEVCSFYDSSGTKCINTIYFTNTHPEYLFPFNSDKHPLAPPSTATTQTDTITSQYFESSWEAQCLHFWER